MKIVVFILVSSVADAFPCSLVPSNHLPVVAYVDVDYTAASEFIEEHYHIKNYFGEKTTKRVEPIWNAREGVENNDGELIIPVGSMRGCGFCLIQAPTMVENFEDLHQIQSVYQEEMR